MDDDELLRLVAKAETVSEHPLGQTIVSEAKKRDLPLNETIENAEIIKGNGLTATVAGEYWVIGNRKLMADQNISIAAPIEAYATEREKAGNTAIFAARNNKLVGVISIADQIKTEAKRALQQLRRDGVEKMEIGRAHVRTP